MRRLPRKRTSKKQLFKNHLNYNSKKQNKLLLCCNRNIYLRNEYASFMLNALTVYHNDKNIF